MRHFGLSKVCLIVRLNFYYFVSVFPVFYRKRNKPRDVRTDKCFGNNHWYSFNQESWKTSFSTSITNENLISSHSIRYFLQITINLKLMEVKLELGSGSRRKSVIAICLSNLFADVNNWSSDVFMSYEFLRLTLICLSLRKWVFIQEFMLKLLCSMIIYSLGNHWLNQLSMNVVRLSLRGRSLAQLWL
jgi:hypothetical protein